MMYNFPVRRMLLLLEKDDLLPTILFRSSRRQCNDDMLALLKISRPTLSSEKQRTIRLEIDRISKQYDIPEDVINTHEQFQVLMDHGVGAHHAGQLLMWRLILEELMARGLLRMMVATGTVAAGVDFPARSVVITAHSKRGSEGFNVLTASEFQQMSGRAGRRGKDTVGYCVVVPGPYCDARVINQIANRPPEPLKSMYFAAPSTVLNLLRYRNVDDLLFTVERSLAAFYDRKAAKKSEDEATEREKLLLIEDTAAGRSRAEKRVRRLRREAEVLKLRQRVLLETALSGLQKLGYVDSGSLTPKGYWAASLYTNIVLELAEAIEAKLFDDIDYRYLAALVASISADSHRVYYDLQDNPVSKDKFDKLKKILIHVSENYISPYKQEVQVVPSAALTVLLWFESKSWAEFSSLLRLAGVAEGDVARLVSQTAENLNQISHLTKTHPQIATVASEARIKLLRPPLVDVVSVA
jgi:ATP-dependent RNA helicase HelY